MEVDEEKVRDAVQHTEIVRVPKQHLSTFGTTNVYYYMLTEPAYAEVVNDRLPETVVREGRVIAERPRIVTPYYLSRLEGFSPNARKYFEMLTSVQGPHSPGLYYTYRNEPKELNIVSEKVLAVVERLNTEIEKKGDSLTTIIKGVDELWDVSLLKFIYEMTRSSVPNNLMQMGARGLLDVDASGVPADVRLRIEELFRQTVRGEREPRELKDELDRWGLFSLYEDRFFSLFKQR